MIDPTTVMLRPLQQTVTEKAASPDAVVEYLDAKVEDLICKIKAQEYWDVITDPSANPAFLRAIMREIYLEIYSYQPHVIEATICSIAQMPRSLDERKFKGMLLHQAEEFSHGEMALRDYVALGGNEEYARNHPISPASFAVSGVWWMMAHMRDPFMYLGAVYLFEGLTPLITGIAKPHLVSQGMPANSLEYIEYHSTEDIRHANLMRHTLKEAVEQYPEAAASIKYGFDCFLYVYPLPVWETAYQRAKSEFKL